MTATLNPAEAAVRQAAGAAMTAADVHILLVDDERLSRIVVGNLLRKCNYQGTPCLFIHALYVLS